MAVSFPALKPASRSFSAPEFPVTVYKSQSGATVRRLWASKAGNAGLRLVFENLSDVDTKSILDAYQAARGNFDALTLPAAIFSGADAALKTAMEGAGLTWRFSDGTPPTVESVFLGRSRVNVTLVGTF
jgi:hypothetical protein